MSWLVAAALQRRLCTALFVSMKQTHIIRNGKKNIYNLRSFLETAEQPQHTAMLYPDARVYISTI